MAHKIWWLIFRLPPLRVFLIGIISASVLGMAHLLKKKDPGCHELKAWLAEDKYMLLSSASASNRHKLPDAVAAFYEENNYTLIWVSQEGALNPSAKVLIRTIENSWQDGLDPSYYHITEIKSLCDDLNIKKEETPINVCIDLDIRLSHAFFSYVCDLYAGRVSNAHWNPDRTKHLNEVNPADSLKAIVNSKSVADILASFSCPHESYKQLRRLLNSYGQISDTMNLEIIRRKKQIALNMERWRWLPRVMPEKYIMTNTAGFDLHVSIREKDTLNMKIIAGKLQQPTPLLTSSIQYLIINPWWEIPHSIATKEMLPLIRQNISYLSDHHIKVYPEAGSHLGEISVASIDWNRLSEKYFPYRLRQMPGPWNALGAIKFIFPNRYQVYFHDTPNPELFQQTERAFSHGCIRIERPLDLASYLLQQNNEWVRKKILTTKEQRLKVGHTSVFICYWTVFINNEIPVFTQDIYGYDLKLQQLLDESNKQTQDSLTSPL